jgi:hypothetical protein
MSNESDVNVKIGADVSGLQTGSQAGADAFKVAATNIKDSITELNAAFAEFNGLLMSGLALGAFGMIGKEVFGLAKNTSEYAHTMELASQKTGMGVQALQGWAFAASFAGGSVETFTMGIRKFSQEIVHAKEGQLQSIQAFQKLGISVNDLKNLKMEDLMMRVADAFKAHADGANKSAEAVALFGRSGLNLIPILNMGSDGARQFMQTAKDLGIVMGDDDVKAAGKFEQQTKLLTATADGLKRKVGMELIPVLGGLVEYFQGLVVAGNQTGVGFQILLGPVQALISLFEGLKFVVQETVTVIIGGVAIIGAACGAMGSAVNKLVHGDLAGARDAMRQGTTEINNDLSKMGNQMMANAKSTSDNLARIWTGSQSKIKLPKIEGIGDEPDVPIIPKDSDNKIAEWKSALEQAQMSIVNGVRTYNEMVLADQQAFWEKKLSSISGNGDKEKKLRAEVVNEIFGLVRQEQAREIQAANEKYNTEMALAQKSTDAAKAELDRKYSLGEISAKDQLAQELVLDENLKAQELKLFEEWKAIEEKKPGEKQKIIDELKKIEEKYNAAVLKDQQKLADENQKAWNSFLKPMENAFSQSLTDMLMKTTTWQKALNNIFKSILNSFINSLVNPQITRWTDALAKMLQSSTIYKEADAALDKTFDFIKKALNMDTNMTLASQDAEAEAAQFTAKVPGMLMNITADAGVAGANAFASAPNPYIGAVLSASTIATVLGLASYVPGAAGGYDIPAGVNPMTQLHQQEMVLPANLAKGLRNMIGNGGRGGGGGTTINHISALDTKSFFSREGRSVIKGMKRHLKGMGVR